MNIKTKLFVALALLLSAPAFAQTDPALLLRPTFIHQYVQQAIRRHGNPENAKKEAGCIFDGMASYITVAQWIDMTKALRDGKHYHQITPPPGKTKEIYACIISKVPSDKH